MVQKTTRAKTHFIAASIFGSGLASGTMLAALLLLLSVFSVPFPSRAEDSSLVSLDELSHHAAQLSLEETERAEYRASWNGIPVASAEVRAAPVVVEGKKFYQVRVQARTWKYLELIWKMRDSIETLFDAETFYPRRFIFRQRENRRAVDTTAIFDPSTKKWSVQRQRGRKVSEYEFVSQHTLDPVSAVYMARSVDFKVGDSLQMEVFGGKSRYLVVLEVKGQEQITVDGREFAAYRIVPRVRNITSSGYAGRLRQAVVWVSADEKRWPLRMVSEVFIGSIRVEIVEVKS